MQNFASLAKLFLWRIVLLTGASLLTVYLFYRVTFINFSPIIIVLSLILFLAEMHTVFHLYGMFYSLWPRNYRKYPEVFANKNLQFNIFICVCGEPAEVVRETIMAAKVAAGHYKNVIGPKKEARIYVINDGKVAKKDNWQEIEALAHELGVYHIARSVAGGFKAGNINNALTETPTSDAFNTLDIILDSDFAAKQDLLTEIVKPFEDPSVDFAQSPQRYKNEKTWVAKASAAHQIFFFDHICASKAHDNALFLCGTNFAIRRSALEAVGGMDTRFITEDYATSLELHLKGYKGVFIPKVLAEGIAPATLKQYFSQQQRWSKGSFDVTFNYLKQIVFGPLSARQKFHYLLSASYYLIGLRDLILMLAPLPYLFFGVALIQANTWQYLTFVYGPLLIYNLILYLMLFRHPIKSLVLDIASFPVFTIAFFSSVLKKDLSFIVTIKKYEKENPFSVYKIQIFVAALLMTGLYFGFQHAIKNPGIFLNFFWAGFDVLILTLGFYLIVRENYNTALFERVLFKTQRIIGGFFHSTISIIPRTAYTLVLVALIGLVFSQTPNFNTNASLESIKQIFVAETPVKELLVPTNGIYYGYYQNNLNTHPQNPITTVVPNEKVSLTMFYQDWETGGTFDIAYAQRLASQNQIPVITWEPRDSVHLKSPDNRAQDIIDGKYDNFIHDWAKNAAIYKQPFFLRFAQEMNGNWYPWGNQNGPESYIKMWQHIHDIFVAEKATNAIWLWSPNNTDEKGSTDSLLSYYPGDNYVDWVGFSGFNWGALSSSSRWKGFTEIAADTYSKLETINKPIMVTETSSVSVGGDKTAWFKQTLGESLPSFPKIKAVIFFNQNFNKADFSLTSGADFDQVVQEKIVNNDYILKNPIFKTR